MVPGSAAKFQATEPKVLGDGEGAQATAVLTSPLAGPAQEVPFGLAHKGDRVWGRLIMYSFVRVYISFHIFKDLAYILA